MKIVICAGGTGGHLLPAKALAEELKNHEIYFVAYGLSENKWFDKKYPFFDITSGTLKNPFAIIKGIYQSLKILLKIKPDVVVGFGSYHSFPPLFAAWLLRKKILVFEPNTVVGRVNRFFQNRGVKVAIQFPMNHPGSVMVERFPWNMKREEDAKEKIGLQPNLKTFLVFGGSLGARFLNKTFLEVVTVLKKKGYDFQVIHLSGNREDSQILSSEYKKMGINFIVKEYDREMSLLYSAADVVVSRSGAATLSELLFFEKASLLIPYPYAAEQHQEKNGYFMQDEVKGALVLLESDAPLMLKKVEELMAKSSYLEENIKSFKAKESNKSRLSDEVQKCIIS